MIINKDSLYPCLLYSREFQYNDSITVSPVKMTNIIEFNIYSQAITVRKDSHFIDKNIIKMTYWEFILYVSLHPEIGEKYNMPSLQMSLIYLTCLLKLVCPNHKIEFDYAQKVITINGFAVTDEILDDLRRIIIIQNDLDFDIDGFLHHDTEERLKKAQRDSQKTTDKSTIEDYIDSLCVAMHMTEVEVMNMSIRKFWRWVKRLNLHENYNIMRMGECSGMVTYKEPLKHWMTSFENDDPYSSLKTDETALKNKINGVNK